MIKGYGRCISLLGPSPLAYWLPPTGSNSALSNRRSFPSTPFLSVSLPRSFYTSRVKRKCQLINGSAKRATWTIKFQSYAWFIVRLFCNTAQVFLQSTLNIDEIDRGGLFTAICDGSQELFPFWIKYCSRSIIFIAAVCIVEL